MTRYCRHIIILLTAALVGSLQAHAQISIGGDVFGGGENGDVGEQPAEGATHVSVYSETVNIVYGGGKNGKVYGDTHVTLGRKEATGYWDGRPAILRSVYGGGYKGAVWGTTHLTMQEGRIGFYYDLEAGDFKYNLNVPGNTHNLLKESGNLYGGGYGEGASVDGTLVKLYDGIVRNSVYGGGEIAAVGRLKTSYSTKVENVTPDEIEKAGKTLVQMYGGQVENDVFGGGRGYAIDAYGNTQSGEVGYADGYTFGQTEVNIFRGTIGTDASVVEGHGNVFGGGNIGYVYSGTGRKSNADGYYYANDKLTEDCKVLVSPYCMATEDVTVNGTAYKQGDYVRDTDLNQLDNSDSQWGSLDDLGITIRNAVFAGGNVSSGSDKVYANAKTVFGNATATVSDLFDKDFITLGEDEIGGLYGDGNLTFVDGYRELNITNYGTDFYNLNSQLTHEEYLQLNDRERAYFELQYMVKSAHIYSYYRCTQPYTSSGGVTYKYNQKISETTYTALSADDQKHWTSGSTEYAEGHKVNQDEYNLMDAEEQKKWDLFGFCTLYAGRMMNTIQRADFCGLFGSRVVLKGAQDRVTNVADQTNYTINRVGEVSLNQNTKDGNVQSNNTSENARGNYFGIYNVVNYLGGLTSDVNIQSVRTTGNLEGAYKPSEEGETYLKWKIVNKDNRKRNNGSSANQVALASGVWLELVKEPAASTSSAEKDYGYITGVVELDLINVSPDEGGGYVYAKNEHGKRDTTGVRQTTLTAANNGAVSNKQFIYDQGEVYKVETSGNFVHSTKRIVDDCYPNHGNVSEKAHYWYIRGEYYVYDQYISAYTGSAQSYAREVNIPLTITAEAQGKLDMQNAWPNKYAYWTDDIPAEYQSKTDSTAILVNGVTYHKNDPITYWDWQRLATSAEKDFFTDQTFVCANDFKGGGTAAGAGDILLSSGLPKNESGQPLEWVNKDDASDLITDAQYQALKEEQKDLYGRTYNRTNAISSDNGFALTLAWDNPERWAGTSPQYKCNTSGVYGQLAYNVGDVVNQDVFSLQGALGGNTPKEGQATFEKSYVAKETCKFTDNGTEYSYVKGACISESTYYNSFTADNSKAHFEQAYVCTQTFQIGESAVYLVNDVLTASEYGDIDAAYRSNFSEAYICKTAGKWGGEYYKAGTDYDALKYCNLSADERRNFTFTGTVLDLLYKDFVPQENSAAENGDAANTRYGTFADMTSINYTATYNGDQTVTLTKEVTVKREGSEITTAELRTGDVLTNEVFESLVNKKKHFAAIVTTKDDDKDKVFYVMKTQQQIGDILYAPGNIISEEKYHALSTEQQQHVAVIKRSELAKYAPLPLGENAKPVTYYYCKEAVDSYAASTIINADAYKDLTNEQANFEIQGKMPTATSTFFVVRDVDINDLQQDKVITAEYVYSYIESDESGASYDEIRERHVINIHIHFESGVPSIGQLLEPSAVLPGARVGLNQPLVTKGAYEILGGGWEIYENQNDASTHKNGLPYINNNTPMYLYQDQYYVAYYAKSYLGKTFSNPVPITVANYHRMEDVMTSTVDDQTNHYMYLDEAIKIGKQPKVYLDNHACKDASKSELDYLADFYTASLQLEKATACQHIDFILQSDLESKDDSWTPIGLTGEGKCFQGNVHGNGNAVKGLTAPLFGSLCGKVYNLGVSGTYNGPLLATSGGTATNCWEINEGTTDTPLLGSGTLTNCYYQSETATTAAANSAMPKTKAQFLDGEVAYRLNSFYLTARGKAEANYVENYYKDGDFIYAGGTIPMQADILRLQSDGGYKPVYPDDYIFFGQTLSYDKIQNHKQDAHPTAILRDADNYNLLWKGNGIVNSNRVYRAPGYYMSKAQGEVYFNKHAVFVGSYEGTTLPYSRLTAIGFAFNNVTDTKNSSQPVLDYDGLDSYQTDGLTQNLLVYADKVGDPASYALLSNALPEPDFAFGIPYNTVARADGSKVKGHLVAKEAGNYVTDRHHLLIDRQNFNCPVKYKMGTDKRMWHQRDPERYGNGAAGWETVCLPFTADVVTTHQKGEITHFYTGSTIGHEYWLRQPSGSSSASGTNLVTIPFAAPAQGTPAKTVDNTFLYDYYYRQNVRDDANADDYQIYYSASRDYADYPRLANGTPYIIAYPDASFYEFDLSGNFEPQNTASPAPAKLDKQTLSFVSAPGDEIKISDDELSEGTPVGSYTFRGTYLAQELGNGYEMQPDGGSFQTNTSGTTIPFRAHFTGTSSNAPAITRLLIGSEGEQQEINDWMGRLHIYTEGQRTLVIESGLDYPVTLHLHNVAGQAIKTIPVPAQSRQTVKVPLSGIYIINHQKIVVK